MKTWTDEQLRDALASNISIAGVLRALGLSTSPGNYKTIYHYIDLLQLPIDHLRGKSHGTSSGGRKELDELLTENSYCNTRDLKKKLIKAGLIEEMCVKCGLGPTWKGGPLSLQLDHINGNPSDNQLGNLRVLCPNCHSQTKTFKKGGGSRYRRAVVINACRTCKKSISPKATQCKVCSSGEQPTKVKWPPASTLVELVQTTSYVEVGRRLGVSDNAVRKRLKSVLGRLP